MKLKISLDKAANIAVIVAAATFVALSLHKDCGWGPHWGAEWGGEPPPAGPGSAAIERVEDLAVYNTDLAATLSSESAKVALIEFSDFQCPYCARYGRETYPQIRRDFVDTELVTYIFFNLPLEHLHPQAMPASEAVECAGEQQKLWEMRDKLYESQGALSEEDLLSYARALGLRLPDFKECLAGAMVPRIRAQIAEAARAAVTSTPTYFIGRIEPPNTVQVWYRLRGAQPYEVFAGALEDALAEAQGARVGGAG